MLCLPGKLAVYFSHMRPNMTGYDTAEFKIILYLDTKSQFADPGLNFSSSGHNFRQVHTCRVLKCYT